MDTVVDFFKPIIAAKMPDFQFFYGSLDQINISLQALEVGRPCICMNNLLPFDVKFLGTGAQEFTHRVTVMIAVKSHPAWGPESRNQAQRVTLHCLRLLPRWLYDAGAKVLAGASGNYFINMFDANLDGVSASFQVQFPDNFDYCLPVLPPIPSPAP